MSILLELIILMILRKLHILMRTVKSKKTGAPERKTSEVFSFVYFCQAIARRKDRGGAKKARDGAMDEGSLAKRAGTKEIRAIEKPRNKENMDKKAP